MLSPRHALSVAPLAVSLLVALVAAAPGNAKTIAIKADIVIASVGFEETVNGKPSPRCLDVAFARYEDVDDATGYSVHVDAQAPSKDVDGGGPPFRHDRYTVRLAGGRNHVFEVRAGSHWFPIGSTSYPGTCGYDYDRYVKSHFAIGTATATVPDDHKAKPKTKPAPKPTTCRTPIVGPVVGTRGEPLEIERRGGGPPVFVKAGEKQPQNVVRNAVVGGRFRLTTGPGEWATVRPSGGTGRAVTLRPGTTAEFEAGKPLKILRYTPDLAGAKPPARTPNIIRTNSCVIGARG